MTGRAFDRAAIVFLGALTFAAFCQNLRAGFVNIDDYDYVVANEMVRQGMTLGGADWLLSHTSHGHWDPLNTLSHMMDVQIWGMNPAGHHLTNILLHAAAVIVLFLAWRGLTGASGKSAWVAAVFAVHPLQVESVAWVAERKNVLSGLFFALTLLAYSRYARRRDRESFIVLFAAYLMTLLAKPVLVTVPFLLLLLDWWPLRRSEPWRKLALEKAALLVPAFLLGLISLLASPLKSLNAVPLGIRLANAARACAAYLALSVWPRNLAVYYPFPPIELVMRRGALAAAAMLAASVLFFGARRRPYLLFGWLWFLIALLPVIGLIQVGGQSMADRYMYLPLIGVATAAAWLAETVWLWSREKLAVLGGGIVSVLAILCALQVRHWHDGFALFAHAARVVPRDCVAYNNASMYLLEQGELEPATAGLRAGVAICPESIGLHANLAFALALQGRREEARTELRAALALDEEKAMREKNVRLLLATIGR